MAVADIIKSAQEGVENLGGGEFFIGKMTELSADCGARNEDEVFDWLTELGDGLAKKGLTLLSGPGKPNDLYAKPQEN